MSVKVLIVEDEPNITESLSFILERAGFSVVSESDGANALHRIHQVAPDVVILDVMLPNRSGFEILRDVMRETPRPRVMMLTAKGQARDRQTAEEIGADRFMTKPFSNADIVAAVTELSA